MLDFATRLYHNPVLIEKIYRRIAAKFPHCCIVTSPLLLTTSIDDFRRRCGCMPSESHQVRPM